MNSHRFDLETALAAWRRSLAYNAAFTEEDLDELAQHVRDQVAGLMAEGLGEEAAFRAAMREMGDHGTAEGEYGKVYWGKRRRQGAVLHELQWRLSMLTNYVKMAFRNLLRQKGYSFLNMAGLTLGMACCLLIFQYVAFEYSFDRFHENADRIYRSHFALIQNGEDQGVHWATGYQFGPTLVEELPEIVRFTRVHPNYGDAVVSYDGPDEPRTFKEARLFFVDPAFLEMFTYPLASGDRERALREPQTVLVSESTARKYFGTENAVGKTLDVAGWVNGPYRVTGVFQDVPPNSHLRFDFLLPVADLLKTDMYAQPGAGWGGTNFITYLETDGRTDPHRLEAGITALYARHRGDDLAAAGTVAHAYLQPLLDIHLNAGVFAPAAVTGNRKTVTFFTVIGLITLVIALVNYVNLATARAMDRAREVGVRKAVGARRHQLVSQFLLESALINLAALGLAVGLAATLLPVVNRVADVALTGALWLDARFWGVFLAVFSLGVLFSGLYPAFVLSSFKPVSVLKGQAGGFGSRAAVRKGLVVVQFAASTVLIAGTAVVYHQLRYMRGIDIGLDLDQILVVEGPRTGSEEEALTAMRTLKSELRALPAVKDIALSVMVPGRGFNWYPQMYRAVADPSTAEGVRVTGIDHDFTRMYGLALVAGEPFREGMNVSPDDVPALVNETLVRRLGFPSNEAAVGQALVPAGGGATFVIRGVLRDFNWSSAHQATEAVLFDYVRAGRSVSMRVGTGDLPEALPAIRQTYTALFPDSPFDYYFADEAFDAQYRNDRRFATLFGAFAGVAVLIACLGLFGLAAFTARQRTKEIGVRKVLGASVPALVALLSKDFLKLVGLALVVAVPVAYLLMQRWLEGFAYRIDLSGWTFLLAGLSVLSMALLTVSYQAVKAALADPVKSLRYE